MIEFQVNGQTYRAGTIDAFKQFHCARRLAPALAKMGESLGAQDGGGVEMITALAEAVSQMSDTDAEYVLNTCLGAVTRQAANGGGWARVRASNGALMFEDIDLAVMLQIVVKVLEANLSGFFSALPAMLPAQATTQG